MASTTAGWSLPQIITKVRSLTGTPSQDQLTDLQIAAYINNYYQYAMPFELKEQIQLKYYDFFTVPNLDTYSFDVTDFNSVQPLCWADGFPVNFYQDPNLFWQDFPQQYQNDPVATGDGSTVAFSGVTQAQPVAMQTAYITDGNEQTQVDNGQGQFYNLGPNGAVGPGGSVVVGSAINYVTGVFNTTFPVAPALNANIYIKYQSYQQNIPQCVLFYPDTIQQTFNLTFRPIPDQVYAIRLQGFINPIGLILNGNGTGTSPTFMEWGFVIAYGAAYQIFSDRGDSNSKQEILYDLEKYERIALGRYIQQLDSSRAVPRF